MGEDGSTPRSIKPRISVWVYRTTSQRKFWTTLQGGLKLQGWLKNQVAWSLQWEGFWETFWKEPRHPSVQPTLCRPAKPILAQFQGQRKSLEMVTETISDLLNRGSYMPKTKGPGATLHPVGQAGRPWQQSLYNSPI